MTWQRWFRRLRSLVTFVALLVSVTIVLLLWHPTNETFYEIGLLTADFQNSDTEKVALKQLLQQKSRAADDEDELEGPPIDSEDRYPRLPGESRRLPGCIIIGARKCGTRALLEFLNLHPDIRTASHELHFFDRDYVYVKGVEWYRRRMPYSLAHQITVEKTPAYFVNPLAPERIFGLNDSIRLLLIVREPVRRTVSDYTQVHTTKMAKGKPHEPFERMVIDHRTGQIRSCYKPVRNSLYYKHFRRWLNYFPLSSIHLVDGDRFVEDPLSELRKVETFLGLEHKIDSRQLYYNRTKGFYCYRHPRDGAKCLGETKGRQHVNISQDVREKLEAFFAPFNRLFFDLTNRTFDWTST